MPVTVFEAYHSATYDLMSYCLFLLPVPFSCIYRGSRASFNKQSSHSGSAHGLPIDSTNADLERKLALKGIEGKHTVLSYEHDSAAAAPILQV